MRTMVLFSLVLSCVLCFQLCSARDTLKAGENITQDSGNLVSYNRTFELGFFSSGSSSVKSYLGIWYHGLEPQTVVWVANRNKPIVDSTGVFRISENGNLVVEAASKGPYWSSGVVESSSKNRTLKLLDSGNLVLMEGTSYIWQSFQNPTDTFLPGMKMNANLTLTCWRDATDPAPGDFTFKLARSNKNYAVEKQSQLYWTLDVPDTRIFGLLDNATSGTSNNKIHPSRPYNYDKSRLLMNSSGEIQFLKWDDQDLQWDKRWSGPTDKCEIYNSCGSFQVCNKNNLHLNLNHCICLPGFRNNGETQDQDGCVRKSAPCVDTNVTFLTLTKIKVGDPYQEFSNATTEADCQSLCLNKTKCSESSKCQAYSYSINSKSTYDRTGYYNTCKIWTRDLSTLVQDSNRGLHLSILVKRSDIVPSSKWCEPCGTNVIPYPLSTGPNCGDPTYNKLNCNKSTGQLSFLMPKAISLPVTSIDEDSRMIFIQIDYSYSCGSGYQTGTPNFPFNVTECSKDVGVIKINWLPAAEPPCSDLKDCEDWPHSTCGAKSEGGSRCFCDSNYNWNDSIMSCTKEQSRNHSTNRPELILIVTLAGTTILACIIAFGIVRRKKKSHNLDRANTRIQESLYESERRVKGLIGLGSLEEKDTEGIEVPCYTFASILAATDNFSDSNKLGRGGYGPVYKGRFPGGQDIAVKRLSSVSTQGLEEFKNEVILIAKLQHRNLVRLRGYCIKGDEKILLYEYMPNKSLDSFIFG